MQGTNIITLTFSELYKLRLVKKDKYRFSSHSTNPINEIEFLNEIQSSIFCKSDHLDV
jgi:hypothetical protein